MDACAKAARFSATRASRALPSSSSCTLAPAAPRHPSAPALTTQTNKHHAESTHQAPKSNPSIRAHTLIT
eukprot:1190536-Prorocentrum_minimum.AAC.2